MHIFFKYAYWEAKLSSQNELPPSQNVKVCLLEGSVILTKIMVSLSECTFFSSLHIGRPNCPPRMNCLPPRMLIDMIIIHDKISSMCTGRISYPNKNDCIPPRIYIFFSFCILEGARINCLPKNDGISPTMQIFYYQLVCSSPSQFIQAYSQYNISFFKFALKTA